MPNHRRLSVKSKVQRFRWVKIHSHTDGCVLGFGYFSKGWPVIAKRLTSLGFTVNPKVAGTRVQLHTNASVHEARSVVVGRRRASRPKIVWIGSLALTMTSGLVLAALASGSQVHAVRPSLKLDHCSAETVALALQNESPKSHISVETALEVGGVRAGTLTCEGSRYSYALELNESKRVLKLEKLDS